jgi:hypothetical protein
MIFFVALIPATMLTVAGYVVLYVAQRSEGGLKSFGRYLSFWAFTLAALVVLGSLLVAAHGGRMHGCMMHGGMMRGCGGEGMAGQCPVMHSWQHGMPGMMQVMPVPETALPAPPPAVAAPGAPPPK